jgi:hypothetical protein
MVRSLPHRMRTRIEGEGATVGQPRQRNLLQLEGSSKLDLGKSFVAL